MATASHTIRVGSTDPIVFQLQTIDPETEDASPYDLTGATAVDLRVRSKDNSDSINFDLVGGKLAITDAPAGEVTFSPAGTEFDAAENWYNCFFRVTKGSKKIDFPHDGEFQLVVIEEF